MGTDAMEIGGVDLKKFLMLPIKISYRSTSKHPLIVGFVLFSLLLYRFFPLLFVILVSSSPVLVSTFVLLGTLLSYGQHSHIPQIDEEDDVQEVASTRNTEIVLLSPNLGDSFGSIEDSSLLWKKIKDQEDDDVQEVAATRNTEIELLPPNLGDSFTSIHDSSLMWKKIRDHEDVDVQEVAATRNTEIELLPPNLSDSFSSIHDSSLIWKKIKDHEDDDVQEVASTRNIEIELLPPNLGDSFGSVQDFSLPWKMIKDHDVDGDDDESFNSDSDVAENLFPDASITDIMPMVDELHPLLDTETPHRDAHESSSDDEFNAASDRSHSLNDIHVESSEEDQQIEDEEDDDEEDEEEGQCDTTEHGTEAVLKWTEDDEKNLMDLGNSELERNQRLESLIARRRARKSFRMTESEMNMMDLDFNGLPFQIAPISTARRNPFDLHYDSYMGPGLPPMPGSAPSVMLARRNPFDLPYDDPLEERPDLAGDSFGEEFMTAHEKDMHYKRCESFNMGAYFFKDRRQEKSNVSRFKPRFVTEEMAPEGRFSRFSRQMSEASESNMSFASETESHSTIANQEDFSNLVEEQLSFQECELNSAVGHTPERVKLESELLEEVHLDSDTIEEAKDGIDLFKVEDGNGSTKISRGTQSRFYSEFIALEEHHTGYAHMNQELGEEQQQTNSSSLSSSVVPEKIESEDEESSLGNHSSNVHLNQEMGEYQQHETIFNMIMEEELSGLEPERGDVHEDSSNFTKQTVVDSDFLTGVEGEDDSHTEAPVYDSSPSASNRDISDTMSMEETLSYKGSIVYTSTSSVNA